jgi:hypothetical protein
MARFVYVYSVKNNNLECFLGLRQTALLSTEGPNGSNNEHILFWSNPEFRKFQFRYRYIYVLSKNTFGKPRYSGIWSLRLEGNKCFIFWPGECCPLPYDAENAPLNFHNSPRDCRRCARRQGVPKL